MRAKKCLPRRRPLWHGRQTVSLQDSCDRRATDTMSDVLQRALAARVAPGGILLRYPNDEPLDFRQDAATSQSCGVRPFPRDQLPVPSENRVGRDDRRDLTEPAAAHPVSVHGQPTALVIGEADPATEARAEDAIFLNQIRDA